MGKPNHIFTGNRLIPHGPFKHKLYKTEESIDWRWELHLELLWKRMCY